MLISIEKVLPAPALADLRAALSGADAPWVDGRITAGYQGAAVKFNQQLDDASALASQWRRVVIAALERHPGFVSATLPNALYPPMFNRYGAGMTFGPHVDGSIRIDPASGRKLRTDVSATLFLSDPQDYDGGELRIHEPVRGARRQRGRRRRRLPGNEPAPGRADHARRSSGLRLLGPEPGPRRRPARSAVRHGHGDPAPEPAGGGRTGAPAPRRLLPQPAAPVGRHLGPGRKRI